jgi:Fe-S cluster assembly iron-binding protein IscA
MNGHEQLKVKMSRKKDRNLFTVVDIEKEKRFKFTVTDQSLQNITEFYIDFVKVILNSKFFYHILKISLSGS